MSVLPGRFKRGGPGSATPGRVEPFCGALRRPRRPGRFARAAIAGAAIAGPIVVGAAGCYSEQRDVNYKPFMSGLAGVKTGTPASGDRGRGGADAAAANEDRLVVEEPDGSTRLVSRSGADLMSHIRRTLAEQDEKLFVNQVLCEQTRLEFVERGLDSVEAYRRLKADEKDILKLFERMPMGERSPFAIVTKLGPNVQRVGLTGMARSGLKYTGFDMVLEGADWVTVYKDGKPLMHDGKPVRRLEPSSWRLRWFVD